MEWRCVATPDRNAITRGKSHDPLSNRQHRIVINNSKKRKKKSSNTHPGSPVMFPFPAILVLFFSSFFFGVVYHLPLLVSSNPPHPIPSHFLPPTPCPQTSSNGYEQLAPTTHDEYSPCKEPHASNDVDVPRQLVGCENLRAQKARPRALVRVYERAARELCGGVICGSGVGRRGASCHCS